MPRDGALRACAQPLDPLNEQPPNSDIQKRSIVLRGHKTSVSLEDVFWNSLKRIAADRQQTISATLEAVDAERKNRNLSSALRIFVVEHYRKRALAA